MPPAEHSGERPSVVLMRGHQVNPWDLGAWEPLADRYRVRVLVTRRNRFEPPPELERVAVPALGASVPPGPLGEAVVRLFGERHFALRRRLQDADIVHAAELGYWFTAQAARLRERLGFKLVVTAWETIPTFDAYRNVRTRPYRRLVLERADLFLAATERAREALLLEGADPARVVVAPPGVDVDRFAVARAAEPPADAAHEILSIGRLVWEKGHQDVMRAVALLRRGPVPSARLVIVGTGPEERRLRAHARDLGVEAQVHFLGGVPYAELPGVMRRASCLVLASLPTVYWEEQFGMVLAEAMAAHLPIVATTSGAIPEVVGDSAAALVAPGDWQALAELLAAGPLSGPPGARRPPESERLERFSTRAAAQRLEAAYERVLGTAPAATRTPVEA